ncbi:MAG TPA: multidrug efflux SMR transporter [Synechococcales cyanobacterium M55_K2018_004]|nr:multidrug efflux SMR transporter [Synechococcales cyanobacterium M55_K2018_004]
MAWILLLLAIASEIFATTCLKLTDGFTKPVFLIGSVIGYPLAFGFFGFSLKEIDVSIGYAIWSGIGVIGTSMLGAMLFKEQIGFTKMLCIALITIGLIGLNLVKK